MNIYVLQHSAATPPGSLMEWLAAKSHKHTVLQMHEGAELPPLSDVDMLVILGGAMNVDEVEAHPWLMKEKTFIKEALNAKKVCLGICLGGQLLAQALGGTVTRHSHWEAGWHGILIGTDERLMVFQWHQDTFTLPPGATRVATNKICENQGFMFGDRVVGLQFHPEATEEWVKEHAADPEPPTGPHVQPPAAMLNDLVFVRPMRIWFFELLDRLAAIA